MSQRNKQTPNTWDAFDRGRASSFGSLESITEDQQQQSYSASPSQSYATRVPQFADSQDESGLHRRRSSIAMRLNSIRQMGGPNSIDNFARSFQRAAGFREITPIRRGSISSKAPEDEEEVTPESAPRPQQKSLLTEQMDGAGPQSQETMRQDGAALQPEVTETTSLLPSVSHQPSLSVRSRLGAEPASLGVSYGTISSRLSSSAQRRASILIQQRVEASMKAREDPDEYKDDVSERPVEIETRPDGEIVERTVGESTVPMSIFNSVNVLIGVGVLALPLGVHYSGWVIAFVLLTFAATITVYTARLLAKCLDTNSASTTYGDIAFLAFGDWGRAVVEFLFIIELTAANVALVIIFGDSMHALIPSVSVIIWKTILSFGLIPLNFAPFRALSTTSVLGISCTMGVIFIVLIDGLLKPHAPGSLREVATTYAFPADIRTVPLSLGLFMAPWGGHSVFPAIYKDMRHPKKYPRAVRDSYIFTYGLDMTMAIIGYLMFGDDVQDELTRNILGSKAYPRALSILMIILIAIIPITKIPLTNRPVMDTMNKKFLIDLRQMDAKARKRSEKSLAHRSARASIGIVVNIVQLGVSIGFPDFDSIMALMGSAFCFTICVILPVSFYLKIFWGGSEIKLPEKLICFALIIICTFFGVLGTVFACLPKDKIGARSCQGKIGCY